MPRHQLHWLQLGRGGVSEVEAAREDKQEDEGWSQEGEHRRRAHSTEGQTGAVGHDLAPPCVSKDPWGDSGWKCGG